VVDEEGNPVPNPARNIWVTQTALATTLNQAPPRAHPGRRDRERVR
jgi:hypothetical protein